MTETPATSSNGQEKAAASRSGYLPVLPTGWDYLVELHGPGGTVRITPQNELADAPYRVFVGNGHDESTAKHFEAASFREAVAAGVDAAKALTQISEHEAKAAAAKQKLLDTIGPQRVEVAEPPKGGKTHVSGADREEAASTETR